MGEAGDEGQAEKGRRERRRQKAASLSGPAFHHQTSPRGLQRARQNFWKYVFVRQVGLGAKRVLFPQVAGSIPDRCLSVWSLHAVPPALVWVLGPPSKEIRANWQRQVLDHKK